MTAALTAAQFEALAQLLSLRRGPAQDGARLVLVDGLRGVDASRVTGASRSSISATIGRIRRGLDLARAAVS